MHNDPIDCFESSEFLKENSISHSILQYNSTLFAEFIVPLLQGFETASILLTYRSNNLNVQDFIGQITHLIIFHKLDLVLGDFNINALRDLALLHAVRQYCYTLLGTEAAHIMGELLDHFCIRNNASFFGKAALQKQPVYY